MITQNAFDPVFDCQRVFKELMNALARPGKIQSIAESMEKIGGKYASILAAGMTLLDNWKTFYVYEKELEDRIKEMTYAVPADLSEADYVFLTEEALQALSSKEVLSQVKPGTLPKPHKSATVFVMLDRLDGGQLQYLAGPGIDKEICITLPDEGNKWLWERQKMNFEFPCGVDLYFLTPEGNVMGVPRKIRIGGEDRWDTLQ